MPIDWKPISECLPEIERALVYATHFVMPELVGLPKSEQLYADWCRLIENEDDRFQIATRLREPWMAGPWRVEDELDGFYVLPTHFALLTPPGPTGL